MREAAAYRSIGKGREDHFLLRWEGRPMLEFLFFMSDFLRVESLSESRKRKKKERGEKWLFIVVPDGCCQY
jgi:hypothetical protein